MAYKPKILVVEGDPPTRRQLEASLRVMGAEPVTVTDGKQATALVNKEKFDGVFLAWDLPGVNAEALCRQIRESKSNSTMPIAMLSQQNDARSIAAGFKAGATFCISKPVGPRELTRLLNATRGAMLAERRRYARVALPTPVVCKWGGKTVNGQGVNLSATGVLVTLSPAPEEKARVELEFKLPKREATMKVAGDVVRVIGNQVAIQFHQIPDDQQDHLRKYVEQGAGISLG